MRAVRINANSERAKGKGRPQGARGHQGRVKGTCDVAVGSCAASANCVLEGTDVDLTGGSDESVQNWMTIEVEPEAMVTLVGLPKLECAEQPSVVGRHNGVWQLQLQDVVLQLWTAPSGWPRRNESANG